MSEKDIFLFILIRDKIKNKISRFVLMRELDENIY